MVDCKFLEKEGRAINLHPTLCCWPDTGSGPGAWAAGLLGSQTARKGSGEGPDPMTFWGSPKQQLLPPAVMSRHMKQR